MSHLRKVTWPVTLVKIVMDRPMNPTGFKPPTYLQTILHLTTTPSMFLVKCIRNIVFEGYEHHDMGAKVGEAHQFWLPTNPSHGYMI